MSVVHPVTLGHQCKRCGNTFFTEDIFMQPDGSYLCRVCNAVMAERKSIADFLKKFCPSSGDRYDALEEAAAIILARSP